MKFGCSWPTSRTARTAARRACRRACKACRTPPAAGEARAEIRLGRSLIQRPYRTDGLSAEVDDVITHIGDHPLDAAGNVQVEAELQLPFFYYVPPLAQGGSVRLTVLRGGESIAVACR